MTILTLIGRIWAIPAIPSGMRSVSAASGPYAAELSASRPKISTPLAGPILSAFSSSVASGRPSSRSVRAIGLFSPDPTCNEGVLGSRAIANQERGGSRRRFLVLHLDDLLVLGPF